jgi:hypothetical protein
MLPRPHDGIDSEKTTTAHREAAADTLIELYASATEVIG